MLRHDSQQIRIRAEPISLRAGITDEAAHWQVSGVNKAIDGQRTAKQTPACTASPR